VKPLDRPLLADENIQAATVARLAARGKDIRSVQDEGLAGRSDSEILRHASEQGRVVLTHDSDFGRLAVLHGDPLVGIVFVRPGHISVDHVMATLAAVESLADDIEPPFIVVAEHRDAVVRVRVRRL
jgi:predicted nuclease of predicted toxin-antitoxin system